jgi:TPR repeat protein
MAMRSLIAAVAIILLSNSAFALPNGDAEAAYARGDYESAFQIWMPLAEQGSAEASRHIAQMYEFGQGVAQDKQMAAQWEARADAAQALDAQMRSQPIGYTGPSTTTANIVGAPQQQQAVIVSPQTVSSPQPVYYPPSPRPAPVYAPAPQPIYVPVYHMHHGWRH